MRKLECLPAQEGNATSYFSTSSPIKVTPSNLSISAYILLSPVSLPIFTKTHNYIVALEVAQVQYQLGGTSTNASMDFSL